MSNNGSRKTGIIKWFNAAKGFGFIQQPGGDDVFLHVRAIEHAGIAPDDLVTGAEVMFDVVERHDGRLAAQNVRLK
jgi:cold shock protein